MDLTKNEETKNLLKFWKVERKPESNYYRAIKIQK